MSKLVEKWLDRLEFIKENGVSKYNQNFKPQLQNFSQVEAENYCKKQIANIKFYEEKEKRNS